MFLKQLELQGFKSFPDKTTIRFDRGMTAVVGPNGSGKSNISDAMRWVMGEQSAKNLRGGRMEDVIFDGTAERKPVAAAVVSLTFDNLDRSLNLLEDEVTVSRRYDRMGESEYRINGKEVRLKDVNELFMDTGLGRDGYAMIGQGKIAEILSAKSRERREIFEEAAGISKFRYRKAEAERQLDAAEQNLLRLYDILSELENRLAPLKEQAQTARLFVSLADRKKTLEISIWYSQLALYREQLKKIERELLIYQDEEQRLALKIEKGEQEVTDAYDKMNGYLARVSEHQKARENLQTRMAELQSTIAVRQNDLLHNRTQQQETKNALSRFAEGKTELLKKIALEREAAAGVKKELAVQEEQKRTGEDAFLALAGRIKETAALLEKEREALSNITLDLSKIELAVLSIDRQNDEQSFSLPAEQKEQAELSRLLDDILQKQQNTANFLSELEQQKISLANTVKGYELKIISKSDKLTAEKETLQRLDLQIKEKKQRAGLLLELDKNMDGFYQSVKLVIKAAKDGQLFGVLGTVAELIRTKEEYALALETALGNALQNIVVEDEKAAKAAIRRLQREKGGRATFLPLTSVRGSKLNEPGLANETGYLGIASELLDFDQRYRNIINLLLGRIVVADDLDNAAAIAKKYGYRFRVVTLDGQQINAGGSYTGGSAFRSAGILSRKNETEKLQSQAKQQQEALLLKQQAAAETEKELRSLQAFLNGAKGELLSAGEDSIRAEAEQTRLAERAETVRARLADLQKRQKQLEQFKKDRQRQRETLKQQQQQLLLQKQEKEQAFAAFSQDLAEQEQRIEQLREAISRQSLAIVSLKKDVESGEERLLLLLKAEQDAKEERQRLALLEKAEEEQEQELILALSRMEKEGEALQERAADYAVRIEKAGEERLALEKQTVALRADIRRLSEQKEKASAQKARCEEQKNSRQTDYDGIILKLWEEYELTYSEAAAMAQQLADRTEAEKELAAVKNQIRSLGNVNLSAIEEYSEVKERHRFLKGQLDDAATAKGELVKLISSLTTEMKRMFSESFAAIGKHFSAVFKELFGGGRGELLLTDPADVLSSGIEIQVTPPGKVIKNLSSLSGGEQAFVAIAIYLAILKVRPAPFCVLDEIEAALDDVNVTKYAKQLRKLCDKTQFILITHRRGTMEEADSLYGVTMQEQGVSRLLQLASI